MRSDVQGDHHCVVAVLQLRYQASAAWDQSSACAENVPERGTADRIHQVRFLDEEADRHDITRADPSL
jgi:hypothetical protein